MNDKILFKNDFLIVSYRSDEQLIDVQWQAQSQEMENEDFKESILNYAKAYVDFKLQHLEEFVPALIDTRKMYFTIEPDVQEWVNQEVMAEFSKIPGDPSQRRVAYLIPEDFYAQLSLEQTNDEQAFRRYDQKYFDSREEAVAWLKAERSLIEKQS